MFSQTYLDWTTIRSPINGVVLEKLVNPNELVVPQSFGGGRGPSTALIAVADPKDLQVQIDLSESDVAKVSLGQKCRVSRRPILTGPMTAWSPKWFRSESPKRHYWK